MTSGRGLLAFDPGVSGGWAWLVPNSADMSVYAWRTETEFLEFLDPINPAGYTAIVEDVPAYVSSMTSNASSFKLGYNFGFLVGALRARRFPVELVKPREWQKGLRGLKPKMGYTDRKRTIKDNAARLYPGLKITNANADAVMIMDWKLNRDA